MSTGDSTSFLYPFLDGDPAGVDRPSLVQSALATLESSCTVRLRCLHEAASAIDEAAAAMAARFLDGGRLLTFGNGGSASDAGAAAHLFRHAPAGARLPALHLTEHHAVVTALANDIGFDVVFARHIEAVARRTDICLGFSTSGNSPNLLAAFSVAHRLGLLTIACSGYDGGTVARSGDVDHCLVATSDSVHRIQEVHAAFTRRLWQQTRELIEGA